MPPIQAPYSFSRADLNGNQWKGDPGWTIPASAARAGWVVEINPGGNLATCPEAKAVGGVDWVIARIPAGGEHGANILAPVGLDEGAFHIQMGRVVPHASPSGALAYFPDQVPREPAGKDEGEGM